jgi:hypothetical protein
MNIELKKIGGALRETFRTLWPSCRDAARLQSRALDHPLPFFKRFGLRLHLLVCKWCRRYGRQIRFLRQAVQKHPEEWGEAAPQQLSPEARERIKRSLQDHGHSHSP